jgi:Arc/MetJ family transcription regulator
MRITIELDDTLVEEAFRYAPAKTKKELVHLALRELIANRRRLDVRDLWATGGIRPNYDHKSLRNGEE